MDEWRQSTWGKEISLEYGKAIRGYKGVVAPYRVYGTNGPVGWVDKVLAPAPGVILGRKGAYRGVHYSKEPFFVIDTAYYVKPRSSDLNMRWIYYAIIHHKLGSIDDGSPIPSTTRAAVYVRELSVPPHTYQEAVAAVLGALDDKIELNRRTNETLEAMARALFKDWFVDFGPTRAKAEHRAPYLAPELWDLFPDRLDPEGKPEGWRLAKFSELTQKIGSGATPRGGQDVYVDEGAALIRSQNVYDQGFSWNGLVRIKDSDAEKLKNVVVREKDVLLNITGASILRSCMVDAQVLPARVNQHVAIVRARENVPSAYLWLRLQQQECKGYLMGLNAGASREAITKGHIESVESVLPSADVFAAFADLTDPLFAQIAANRQQALTLAQTRDLLLPKLMSGEIRLKDAEKAVEAVA